MDFWDLYPFNLKRLEEKVEEKVSEIIGKKVDGKLILYPSGIYTLKGKKKVLTKKALEKRLNETGKELEELRKLILLHNATQTLLENYEKAVKFLTEFWGEESERKLRREMLTKGISTNSYSIAFARRMRKYLPNFNMGTYLHYRIENAEQRLVRIWTGNPIIDGTGKLTSLGYKYIGKAKVKNLGSFKKHIENYHSILYLFAYKFYLKPLVEHYVLGEKVGFLEKV